KSIRRMNQLLRLVPLESICKWEALIAGSRLLQVFKADIECTLSMLLLLHQLVANEVVRLLGGRWWWCLGLLSFFARIILLLEFCRIVLELLDGLLLFTFLLTDLIDEVLSDMLSLVRLNG